MEPQAIDPNDIDEITRQIAELQAKLAAAQQAQLQGSGAINQGSGKALGAHAINIEGPNPGIANGGTMRDGYAIGRDLLQFITQITHSGEDPEEAKSVIAHYLEALSKDLAGLKLGDIDSAAAKPGQSPLELADIYVPLDTTLLLGEKMSLGEWLNFIRTKRGIDLKKREMRPASALEALAEHPELTLLGKPGSGKSTFGAKILLTLAQAWQGHAGKLAELGQGWRHGPLLPIRVILRRFAAALPPGEEKLRAGDLWAFVAKDLDADGYGLSADTLKYVQRIARDHGALILLDGLDECGDPQRRERVMSAVQDFMRNAGEKCRFVLTARPYAWPDGADPARGVYLLADLNDGQIEQFIHAWYAALVKRAWLSPGEAERKREDLLKVRQRADLLPLAQNPLLLTLMTTLHTNRGRLPDDRADLYNDSVELLMLRWNQQIGADRALLDELAVPGLKLSDLREVLEELAFKIHEKNVGQQGAADIGEDALRRAFCPLLGDSRDKAGVVVEYIEKRAGLLLGQGEKDGERQFAFPHRTFQEFLAACHLAAKSDFAAQCVRLGRAAPGHWQVVLPLAARIAKAERGASAADALVHGVSYAEYRAEHVINADDWACVLLAGKQLQEIGLGALNKDERTRAIARRVAGWLLAGLPLHPDEGGAEAVQRAQMGDVLAALGDPRFDPQRFHLPNDDLLGFALIPADPDFCIGTRKKNASNSEFNDQPTPTREFYIARYPVTVAQFRAYVTASGKNPGDADALRDPDNRPVTRVSWDEAREYCEWLQERLAALPDNSIAKLLNQGWRVALPSELEWEKAARGGLLDQDYLWGDDADANRANFAGTGIDDTSAVGCFAANGYGLYDMSGNVWEWTRSLWGKDWQKAEFTYLYDPGDGREALEAGKDVLRVVRGGCWIGHPDLARCACRDWYFPFDRYFFLGFRVVLRSPPV